MTKSELINIVAAPVSYFQNASVHEGFVTEDMIPDEERK